MAAIGAAFGGVGAVLYEAVSYWQGMKTTDKIANIASGILGGGFFMGISKYLIESGIDTVLLLKECGTDPKRECGVVQYLYIGTVALPLIFTIGACCALFHPPRTLMPPEEERANVSTTGPIDNQ